MYIICIFRKHNSALSFCSMGSNIIKPPGIGPYCFKVQGQMYHFASALHPSNNIYRKFAQLYKLYSNESTMQRMKLAVNNTCESNIMNSLNKMLLSINPFARSYRMLHDVELTELRQAQLTGYFYLN